MLEYDARLVEAVEAGRGSGRRGGLIDHNEVVDRIEKMLRAQDGKEESAVG